MASQQEFDELLNEILEQASTLPFSYVSVKAGHLENLYFERHGNPGSPRTRMACEALRKRFRPGTDLFRRGKDRHDWHDEIVPNETPTYEVLFEIRR